MAFLSKRRADAKEGFNSLVADVKENGLRATLKDRGVKGFIKEGLSEPVMALIIVVFGLGIAVFILVPIWNNITESNEGLGAQMDNRFDQLIRTQDVDPDGVPE